MQGMQDPQMMPQQGYPQQQQGYPQPTQYSMNVQIPNNQYSTTQVSDWMNSFCGCFSDIPSCCMSYFCPCVQYGQNQESFNGGGCCGHCCIYTILMCVGYYWCMACSFRSQIRRRYNIPGGDCTDCLAHFCCPCCALAQEAREISDRKNMSAGMNTNMTMNMNM